MLQPSTSNSFLPKTQELVKNEVKTKTKNLTGVFGNLSGQRYTHH